MDNDKDSTINSARIKTWVRVDPNRFNDVQFLCTDLNISRDRLFDSMIYVSRLYRVSVVSIRCKISKKVYVDLFDLERVLDHNFKIDVFIRCEPSIKNDMLLYGVGEFEIEVHAIFQSNKEAMDYRDFLINRLLDLGYQYYGFDLVNGIIPRFLCLRVDLNIVDNLFAYCRKAKTSVNKLFTGFLSGLDL